VLLRVQLVEAVKRVSDRDFADGAEAYALTWDDVLDDRGKSRKRLRVHSAISGEELSTTKSQRAREPELFAPVARELVELHLAQCRPDHDALVFPDAGGGHLRRQNWRRRVWVPALERAGVPYFRSYDLRHTCATLLLTNVMRDAAHRRRVPIAQAIRTARAAVRRRPW
jgi:integrase